jgi:hypothetical protein
MTQPHCALANVNEVLDSDKEAAGDGDKDMGTDDDQPTLPLAFEIDLDRHQVTGPEGSGTWYQLTSIVHKPVPQPFAHTAAPDTSNAELDWNW